MGPEKSRQHTRVMMFYKSTHIIIVQELSELMIILLMLAHERFLFLLLPRRNLIITDFYGIIITATTTIMLIRKCLRKGKEKNRLRFDDLVSGFAKSFCRVVEVGWRSSTLSELVNLRKLN